MEEFFMTNCRDTLMMPKTPKNNEMNFAMSRRNNKVLRNSEDLENFRVQLDTLLANTGNVSV